MVTHIHIKQVSSFLITRFNCLTLRIECMTGSVALLSGENPHDVVLVLVDLFASKSSTSTVVMYFIGLGSNVQNNSKTATKFKKTQQIHVIKIWLHVIIRFWVR